jgi:arabinose-5-phosphate isomerase
MREVLLTMASGRLGCVGVVDQGGMLTGIVTDGDVRRHVSEGFEARKARDVMTREPKVVAPERLAAEALALMSDKKITQLFVLEEGTHKPLGVLHMLDCLRAGLA